MQMYLRVLQLHLVYLTPEKCVYLQDCSTFEVMIAKRQLSDWWAKVRETIIRKPL